MFHLVTSLSQILFIVFSYYLIYFQHSYIPNDLFACFYLLFLRNSGGVDNSTPRDSLENSQTEIIYIENEVDWSTHCSENYRGICMIGFLSPSSLSTSASSDEILQGTEILLKAMKSLGKSGSAFRFLSIDAVCQQDFLRSFNVDTHEVPTVAIYSPSKRRYQQLKGSFSEVRKTSL